MKKFGKRFTGIIGAAAAIVLVASLALAGEARMLTDEELDQITGANFNIDFTFLQKLGPRKLDPQKLEETIARVSEQAIGEQATGQMGPEAAAGFGAVSVGSAFNSLIITQTNIVMLSGSGGGSIRQSNIVNFGGIKK